MKQSPVQWLYDRIGDTAPYEYAGQIASYLEEAMKMEEEQRKSEKPIIQELSDEEIKEKMFGGQYDDQDINDVGEFEAAKWYRKQLKQRQ